MVLFGHARTPIVWILLICAILTLVEGVTVNPSYAQMNVQSHTHTHTNGPSTFQGSASSTLTTISGSTEMQGHGRRGGVPPGLLNAWAHSNMSVVARAVTHAIFMNGTHGVELAQIAIAASSNGQMIRNVAFNESVAKVDFDHDGSVELDVNSSSKPTTVFADDNELPEAQLNIGLTPNSNAWVYDDNSHMLRVYADPSSITIFYSSSQAPLPEFPAGIVALVLLASLIGTVLAVKKRSRRTKGKWV
jgi:hypothetical protein